MNSKAKQKLLAEHGENPNAIHLFVPPVRGLPNLRALSFSILLACSLASGSMTSNAASQNSGPLAPPEGLNAFSRQLRVDLIWDQPEEPSTFEVQRASSPTGPFETLRSGLPTLTAYSDYLGIASGEFYYRVRSTRPASKGQPPAFSEWSPVVKGSPQKSNAEELLTEVQEAGFRYFYNYAHPVSGLAREGTGRDPDECAIGASGMGLHNLVVGVARGFITRKQGVDRSLKMLQFLSSKAARFHGAFPHLINGQTGAVIPFSRYDDGADLVETAFLMQGIILVREYFSKPESNEIELRHLADNLWRGVEWDWFASETNSTPGLMWHWSPKYGWKMNLPISGFNECQIVYTLALASPTHPIKTACYLKGWENPKFGSSREQFGVSLELGHGMGPPLFFTQYSYLGLDPHQITYDGKSYFEHFKNLCRVQVKYAQSEHERFKNYGLLWGITASKGPDGYDAFAPGLRDNGTLAPTAALSSMPYLPDESRSCLAEMYDKHGSKLWGPFGFYDAFNFSRDWVAGGYLGIDVGPIAPMIENYRTGLCWKTFMKAPEIGTVVEMLAKTHLVQHTKTAALGAVGIH